MQESDHLCGMNAQLIVRLSTPLCLSFRVFSKHQAVTLIPVAKIKVYGKFVDCLPILGDFMPS